MSDTGPDDSLQGEASPRQSPQAGSETSSTKTPDSKGLIRRVKSNDPTGWPQLCRVYGPLVYRWSRRAGLQDSDAADVGQEVFATVATRLVDFDHSRPAATFQGWLWTITRNKLGNFLSQRDARAAAQGGGSDALQHLQLPDAPPDDSDSSLKTESQASVLLRLVEVLREEFEPTTWKAFWLSAAEGRSPDEIGRELGISRRAAIQRAYRVRVRLRQELGER